MTLHFGRFQDEEERTIKRAKGMVKNKMYRESFSACHIQFPLGLLLLNEDDVICCDERYVEALCSTDAKRAETG